MDFPTTIPITNDVLRRLRDSDVSTSFSQADFVAGRGWLAELEEYKVGREFSVEGPCGFFGGIYGPNPWTVLGGLCEMGAGSYSHSALPEGLTVGRYSSLGKGLRFLDFAHPSRWATTSVPFFRPVGANSLSSLHALCEARMREETGTAERRLFDPKMGLPYPVIQNDVWIGENVALSMGITIGTGAIIGSGAVVTKDVPPYAVMGGVSAKVLKMRFHATTIDLLLRSEWWRYDFVSLSRFDVTNPAAFAQSVLDHVAAGALLPWQPKTLRIPEDLVGPPPPTRSGA